MEDKSMKSRENRVIDCLWGNYWGSGYNAFWDTGGGTRGLKYMIETVENSGDLSIVPTHILEP